MKTLTKRQSDLILSALRARDEADARVQQLLIAAGIEEGERPMVGPQDGLVRFMPATSPAQVVALPAPVPMPSTQPKTNGAAQAHGEAESQA